MPPDLFRLCGLLRAVAEDEIMRRFQRVASQRKADGSLVTEADLEVQRRIVDELGRQYPGIPVLGEEMAGEEQQRFLSRVDSGLWCLDPLDGTSNFACGFPYFAVSLALLRRDGPMLGVILDPVRGECFSAERGKGAFLDGYPIRLVSEWTELGDCLAAVDLKRLSEKELVGLGRGAPYRSQRNLGSVALDWCWLAAGRIQLYLHGGQRLWDYSAGRLIASEAGVPSSLFAEGGVMAPPGLSLEPRMAVAASNQPLFERWTSWLQLPRERA